MNWDVRIQSPCKDCKERYVSCHTECLKYADYRQRIDVYNEKIRHERDLDNLQRDRMYTAARRAKKGYHNKGGTYERPTKGT